MRIPHPRLVLLIVVVALLTRNAAWAFPMLPPAQPQEQVTVATNGQACHEEKHNADRSSSDDGACRIACDLGTMLPLAVARMAHAHDHAPVRVSRLHSLAFSDPLPPEPPPPR